MRAYIHEVEDLVIGARGSVEIAPSLSVQAKVAREVDDDDDDDYDYDISVLIREGATGAEEIFAVNF